MENSALRRCCIILGLVFSFLAREAYTLQCYHCGYSQQLYQSWEDVDIERQTFPVASRKTFNNKMLSRDEVESLCDKETCQRENSACLKWSFFTSNHPMNTTYMCTGNPSRIKNKCYKQNIPGEDFLKLEVCLCDDRDRCNSGAYSSNLLILTLAGLFLAALHHGKL